MLMASLMIVETAVVVTMAAVTLFILAKYVQS